MRLKVISNKMWGEYWSNVLRIVSCDFDGELFYRDLWINIASSKFRQYKWCIFCAEYK